MKQLTAIALLTVTAFEAPCFGRDIDRSCTSDQCESDSSSLEDDVAMMQVSMHQKPKEIEQRPALQEKPKEMEQRPASALQGAVHVDSKAAEPPKTLDLGLEKEKVTETTALNINEVHEVHFECDFVDKATGEKGRGDGFAPLKDGRFPLAVYLQGTNMPYKHPGAIELMKEMGDRDFVVVNVQYDNMDYPGFDCTEFDTKAKHVAECIMKFCNSYHKVDCSKGVATYGYSQGGQVAMLMGAYDDNVTATLAISSSVINIASNGVQKDCLKKVKQKVLPRSKRRIVIGDKDGFFGGNGTLSSGTPKDVIANARFMSEYGDDDGCTAETYDCIQPDGSGYFVATTAETGIEPMNHLWWLDCNKTGFHTCIADVYGVNPIFLDAPKDKPWGLTANFDWLAKTATAHWTATAEIEKSFARVSTTPIMAGCLWLFIHIFVL